MGTEQRYRENMLRIVEALNAGDLVALGKVVEESATSDYVGHLPGTTAPVRGLEGMKQWFRGVLEAYPGMQDTIEDLFTAGDMGAARITGHRTDPATGKAQHVTSILISRLRDGLFAEDWEAVGQWEDDA